MITARLGNTAACHSSNSLTGSLSRRPAGTAETKTTVPRVCGSGAGHSWQIRPVAWTGGQSSGCDCPPAPVCQAGEGRSRPHSGRLIAAPPLQRHGFPRGAVLFLVLQRNSRLFCRDRGTLCLLLSSLHKAARGDKENRRNLLL